MASVLCSIYSSPRSSFWYTTKLNLSKLFSTSGSRLSMAAVTKVLVASIFLTLILLHSVQADDRAISGTSTSLKIDCGGACAGRCKLSGRANLCKRACGTCCSQCNCVPPGTNGNYEACPCYASLTTRNNKRKCP